MLLGLTLFSNAQSADDQTLFKGIKAGWHYSNMYRDGSAPYNHLSAFYVGFFTETKVSDNMKIGSSLEYFQNGFENSESKFKMHTLSLPFYAKVYVGPVYGIVGAAFNFKLSDNREDFPGGAQSITKVTDTKFFDLPLSLGLGVEIGKIQVEAKYNWGLFTAASLDGLNHKNQYLQIGVGFMF